jgi:hypothetical protein
MIICKILPSSILMILIKNRIYRLFITAYLYRPGDIKLKKYLEKLLFSKIEKN